MPIPNDDHVSLFQPQCLLVLAPAHYFASGPSYLLPAPQRGACHISRPPVCKAENIHAQVATPPHLQQQEELGMCSL